MVKWRFEQIHARCNTDGAPVRTNSALSRVSKHGIDSLEKEKRNTGGLLRNAVLKNCPRSQCCMQWLSCWLTATNGNE